MSCKRIYTSASERGSADGIDEGIEDHEGCCAVHSAIGDIFGARFLPEKYDDEAVHQDGGEHGEEDPEVVEPEAFD